MDLMDVEDLSRGCEGKNCGLTPGFLEDCSNQDCYWEEPMFGLIELVCVTVVYIPLMIFGLLGNILTILVVWLRPHMRSSTYLYLSSMAISDLLILLLLPLDLYKLWRPRPWPLGDLACKLTMFLSECCTFCTILHITFLSLERYLAVCWPITAKTVVTRRRTRAIIGCLWLGAAVSAAPVLVMVGVEDVGGEEPGLSQWREDAGWTSREGEQGGLMIGGGERGGEHMALLDPGLEGKILGEKKTKTWNEEFGEFKWFDNEGESKPKEGDKSENEDKKVADEEGGEEEGNMEFEGEQQNKKKEDEGGGRQGNVYGNHEGEIDRRECRCTHYAISSGLLSAMMILSNLYFLIPLCILGLVYSLIGRTLWLRPKSNRRDQSHRNTVKMLGVIVLAFVLCWLPFHVGRTIYLYPDTQMYFLYYLSQYFNLVSSVLFYLSAAVNPLLYNLMSARYRLAVHSLIHKHSHTQAHRLRILTARHSTTTL
ncbi:growth hormone secretagogue receptor type 1-like [Melanotaenia boesemani]|uniref:growth hormone secretagogue receptor type 1-like n=1 Tax=Melanotaenia boesemani TaxID=1250792 RepID=UPI001C059808|nr:growth hormone secretagogue receptor type 1-like [Melanotaenia boesemani]